jgi:hypothetical protein
VLGDGDAADVAQVLEGLVDQSLLQVADTPTGTRFRMLETVREFSTAEREAAAETDRVVGRFLAWARDFGVAHNDAPSGPTPSRRWSGSGPSRTTSPRRSATGWPGRTPAPSRPPPRCSGGLWLVESNYPHLQAVAHARISELCLQVERGAEARRHLLAVLPIVVAHAQHGRLDLAGRDGVAVMLPRLVGVAPVATSSPSRPAAGFSAVSPRFRVLRRTASVGGSRGRRIRRLPITGGLEPRARVTREILSI